MAIKETIIIIVIAAVCIVGTALVVNYLEKPNETIQVSADANQ